MEILNIEEASRYLKVSVHTLNRWRGKRQGPAFIKMGRYVKYSKDSLDAFLKKHEIDPSRQG